MKTLIQNLKLLINKDGKRLILPIICSVLDSMLNTVMYGVMLIVLIDLSKDGFTKNRLITYTCVMAVVFLFRCVLQAIGFKKAQTVGPDVSGRLRMKLGNHIRSLNLGFFNKNSIGKLTGTLLTDVTDFETIVTHCLCDVIKVISFIVMALIVSFLLDWRFGIVVTILNAIGFPLLLHSGKLASKHSDLLRETKQTTVSRIMEYINGIRTFRLYNMTGTNFTHLDTALKKLRDESTRSELSVMPLAMSFSAISAMIVPAALLLGTWLLIGGNVNIATYIIILLFAVSISSNMTVTSSLYPQVRSVAKAADSIVNLFKENPLPYQEETISTANTTIQLSNVSFGYNEKSEVLHNINFTAQPGTVTALIGPSGSGKTTIISLISRFWDVTKGKITIGGKNIQEIQPDALVHEMSIVFQDVYLLCDTVRANICIGKPNATETEIITAAKAAHCHEFIMNMEHGYDTVIGEGGSTLSGGERQRIAIARALLRDAPIVLLDETTSSLDADNEREIQHAFDNLMREKTVIVIAHRLNTIVNANNILVLDQGRIIESGSHEDLINHNGWYARMIKEQRQAENWSVK